MCFPQNFLGKEQERFSRELNVFIEHLGRGTLGWIGAQLNKYVIQC